MMTDLKSSLCKFLLFILSWFSGLTRLALSFHFVSHPRHFHQLYLLVGKADKPVCRSMCVVLLFQYVNELKGVSSESRCERLLTEKCCSRWSHTFWTGSLSDYRLCSSRVFPLLQRCLIDPIILNHLSPLVNFLTLLSSKE